MKKIKNIVLVLFILVGVAFFVYDDAISTYAVHYSNETLSAGKMYKSGDTVDIKDKTFVDEYSYDSGNPEVRNISYNIYFSDVDGNPYDTINIYWDNPNYTFTLPKYEERDIYWKITYVSELDTTYGYIEVYMEPIDYTEPTFEVNCDATEIKAGQCSKCKISSTFAHGLSAVDLTLDIKGFTISDEKALGQWRFARDGVVTNRYRLGNVANENIGVADTLISGSITTQDLFEFNLTAPADGKTTSLRDNVKIKDIEYSDTKVANAKTSDVKTTLNMKAAEIVPMETPIEEPKKEEKVEENPKTGIQNHEGLLIAISGVCIVSLYLFKKKNFLKKI